MLQFLIEEIIQSSLDNSSGTILDEESINHVMEKLINSRNLNKDYIDNLLAEHETDSGYLLKYSDFVYALKDYVIGDNIQHDLSEDKPEKDYEMIELMYSDFHSECGDR